MNIYDKIILISFFLFILFVLFLITFKYFYNCNAIESIYNFNDAYNSWIHRIYMYFHFDKKNETLYTNYELNNGFFKDIKNQLHYIRL